MIDVDGKDVPFQQMKLPHPTQATQKKLNKSLNSRKYNCPALRYEVGTCLLSNDIVWIAGPYFPGDWNDILIFRQESMENLEENERVEADDGYLGEDQEKCRCAGSPGNIGNEERQAMSRQVQGRIEIFNKNFTHWKCLDRKFVAKGTPE